MFDALIIGGGPGGSSAATYLAKAGKRVLLLEKEQFPRFHIGESLLPYNKQIFDELGITEALENGPFPKKFGAQFHLGDGIRKNKFRFRDGRFTREPQSYQVERAEFDHLLLKHARTCGVDAREGWSFKRFESNKDSVTVEAADPTGAVQTFTAKFLIDASGRGNVTGNQEKVRVTHPHLKKLAIFGHFKGVMVDEGERGGDTVIARLENKWFWFIPIGPDKVSVGCVMDAAEFSAKKEKPEAVFQMMVQSSPAVVKRMEKAELVSPIHVTSDFSYRNSRLVGQRLLRIGDAAGFMDPIFSSGVYLAMLSGKMAAEAVTKSLRSGTAGERNLAVYEKKMRRAMDVYLKMVEEFYTRPFVEVLMHPHSRWGLPCAVNALLAGELEGGWSIWWRMRMFFLIVKIQERWPIVPAIRYLRGLSGAKP